MRDAGDGDDASDRSERAPHLVATADLGENSRPTCKESR
jgi:hypothetical protein